MNKVPRWVFRYVGNKTFDFSSKKKDFLPKNDQIWPKIGIFGQFGPGHAGLFGALLVGRLVVVARGLYLARHLFTIHLYHRSYHYGAHIVRTLCFSCRGLHKMHTSTKYIAGLVFANRSKKICIYNIHSQLKVNLKLFWCQHHYKGVLSTAYPIYLELRVFLRET